MRKFPNFLPNVVPLYTPPPPPPPPPSSSSINYRANPETSNYSGRERQDSSVPSDAKTDFRKRRPSPINNNNNNYNKEAQINTNNVNGPNADNNTNSNNKQRRCRRQRRPRHRKCVKIVHTKMYEPVSDGCVTIINPSKYGSGKTYDQQSDVDEEDCTSGSVYEQQFQNRHNNQQQQQQQQQQQRSVSPTQQQQQPTPPDKPPRRNKLQKQLRKQSLQQKNNQRSNGNSDCALLNRRNCEKMRTGNGDNYIDVEHITLESERNYKNRFHSIGVQTSQLLPYRLRFWPRSSSDVKCDPSGNSSLGDKLRCCGRTLSQWFFSQIGLTIILINWALLGAAAFYKTEGPREREQAEDLETLQKDLAIDLATALRQVSEYSQVWPQTIYKYMAQHETLLLEAVSAGYGEGGGGSIWTYPGCILFAVSLLTTLGFGAPVPRTPLGRGAAVLFSAVGIPLHFLLILNIGNLTGGKLQQLFKHSTESTIPIHAEVNTPQSKLLKWFPFISIAFYYALGAVLFGFVRQRSVVDSLMFPLDFTAAGGVAKTSGHVRIFYALYLEVAVILAATIVSLIQASATRGVVDLGLRLGLLTNT